MHAMTALLVRVLLAYLVRHLAMHNQHSLSRPEISI